MGGTATILDVSIVFELQPVKLCPLGEPYGDSGNNFYLATNFVSR
jgi:hypothetical protein